MESEESKRFCKSHRCGKALKRRDGETASNWKRREYCDKSCAAEHGNYKRKRRYDQWIGPGSP